MTEIARRYVEAKIIEGVKVGPESARQFNAGYLAGVKEALTAIGIDMGPLDEVVGLYAKYAELPCTYGSCDVNCNWCNRAVCERLAEIAFSNMTYVQRVWAVRRAIHRRNLKRFKPQP